jgi:hypothetical protein
MWLNLIVKREVRDGKRCENFVSLRFMYGGEGRTAPWLRACTTWPSTLRD